MFIFCLMIYTTSDDAYSIDDPFIIIRGLVQVQIKRTPSEHNYRGFEHHYLHRLFFSSVSFRLLTVFISQMYMLSQVVL